MALNEWTGLGRLGKDPELNVTKSNGKRVCSTSICVDRDQNQHTEETSSDWINLVLWEKNAEIFCSHLKKGDPVLVRGRLRQRDYTDIKGVDRTRHEVVVDKFWFIGPRSSDRPAEGQGPGGETFTPRRRYKNGRSTEVQAPDIYPDDSDEELPF